jgi:hypothetical protein
MYHQKRYYEVDALSKTHTNPSHHSTDSNLHHHPKHLIELETYHILYSDYYNNHWNKTKSVNGYHHLHNHPGRNSANFHRRTGLFDLSAACGGLSGYLLNHPETTLNADYGYAAAA